jgi:hypothetical protein
VIQPNAFNYLLYECFIEAGFNAILEGITIFNQNVKEPIDILIGKSEFFLISLTVPKVRARRFVDNDFWDSNFGCQLTHLSLAKITNGVKRTG